MTGFSPPIWATRTRIVLGQGDRSSKVVFVGEAPSREEDAEGAPFTRGVGEIFDLLLDSIGLNGQSVYVPNLVKCRPADFQGGDREPTCSKVIVCLPNTLNEINEIKPKVLCPMGSLALGCFLPATRSCQMSTANPTSTVTKHSSHCTIPLLLSLILSCWGR